MVVAVVIPSFDTRTASNRDVAEANLYFPEGEDIGTEVEDIPIVLVYNNEHHYTGTRSIKKNFKDGIDALSGMLKDCRILGDALQNLVEDNNCKKLIAKVSETTIGFHYEIDKMVQTALEIEGLEEALEPSKKRARRDSGGGTKKRLNREGKTCFDELTCHCGVQKQSQDALDDHIERRHKNRGLNNWECIMKVCEPKRFRSVYNYALKKHVQNKHFREFYYHCKYCDYATDEAHLLENHNGGKHKLGVSLPCVNLGCSKMFNSAVSRDRHMKYCGVGKTLKCQYCKRVYKREVNLKRHDEIVHQKIGNTFYCNLCEHTYQSKTTYSAHYKNNQCYKVDGAPADVDEEEGGEGEGEDEEGEEGGDVDMPPLEGDD